MYLPWCYNSAFQALSDSSPEVLDTQTSQTSGDANYFSDFLHQAYFFSDSSGGQSNFRPAIFEAREKGWYEVVL